MNQAKRQAEDERQIFEAFAKIAPFTVLPCSIESRESPAPDILCQIENRGLVAFELTELIDQAYMDRIGLMFKTKQYLNSYWQSKLNTADSTLFRNKYSDALLHFEYSQESSLKERKDIAKKAFPKLLLLPNDSDGEFLKFDRELAPILQSIQISRVIGLAEPIIDVNSYVRYGDPTAQAITKKFKKNYECDYPIELLAHINMGIMPHEDVWIAAAEKIASQLSGSPFRKIWVFDNTDKKIKYAYEQ